MRYNTVSLISIVP